MTGIADKLGAQSSEIFIKIGRIYLLLADFLYFIVRMKSVRRSYLFLLLFLLCFGFPTQVFSQGGFQLPHGKNKDRIAFQLINNLVVIPVELNGKKLSFLLDTGVDHTLLFSLAERDSLQINNVTPVMIRGLGDGGDFEALKSLNNTLKVGDAVDKDHMIYVIFNKQLNFSPRMGIPIHGIIGHDLFKDFVIRTNYDSEFITLFKPDKYKPRKCRNCESFDIVLSRNKPYVQNTIVANDTTHEVTLLIDSGASDALWLFDEKYGITDTPKNYFEDFLGLGLSGNVNGKRSKLEEVSMGSFSFKDVNVAYPDSLALKNLNTSSARHGTLGSDILRRFTVTMDYPSKKLILRKNNFYSRPFHYNMSGIVLEHRGLVPVKSVNRKSQNRMIVEGNTPTIGAAKIDVNPLFTFYLTPKFVVAELREGSPADLAGVSIGDEVISINGKPFYQWNLSEINALFTSKDGRKIVMEVLRNSMKVKKRFTLKKML